MTELAKKLKKINVSETGEIQKQVLEMEAKGKKVIKFHIGEPDLPTPINVIEATIKALRDGRTKYGDSRGLKELRDAVSEKTKTEQNLAFDPGREIIIAAGAKQALYESFEAILDPGDRVLVPLPAWVSYSSQIKLAGGKPLFFDTAPYGFHFTKEALEEMRKIFSYVPVKAMVLNSPNNPTGAVYGAEELKNLAALLLEFDITVISDDIYEKIVFDGRACRTIAAVEPRLKNSTIIVNGVSKTYAMTGMRIGWILAPEEIISAVAKIHGAIQTHPGIPEQYGALEALTGPQTFVEELLRTFEQRRNYAAKKLKELGINFFLPEGAFYIFADISLCLGKKSDGRQIDSSSAFAGSLLAEEQVATVSGAAFGKEGYIRISFATDMDNIRAGMERLERFLAKLK